MTPVKTERTEANGRVFHRVTVALADGREFRALIIDGKPDQVARVNGASLKGCKWGSALFNKIAAAALQAIA